MVSATEERQQLRRRYLQAAGYADWQLKALQSDASSRRYFRLGKNGQHAILMDAAGAGESVERFQRIANHLRACGVRTPRILTGDNGSNFLIIEDFGDCSFTTALDEGGDAGFLYSLAVDVLVTLQRCPQATDDLTRRYDTDRIVSEAELFSDWFVRESRGTPLTASEGDAWRSVWPNVVSAMPAYRETLVHRDFHAGNLMLLGEAGSTAECGVLDFQDALIGPQGFDLMSLLEDARRDISADIRTAMIARYRAAMGDSIDPSFDDWFSLMAVHRHLRVLGIFVRLWRRDGKPAYLAHLGRIAGMLQWHRNVRATQPVFDWLDTVVPELERTADRLSGEHAAG